MRPGTGRQYSDEDRNMSDTEKKNKRMLVIDDERVVLDSIQRICDGKH